MEQRKKLLKIWNENVKMKYERDTTTVAKQHHSLIKGRTSYFVVLKGFHWKDC